MTALRLGLLVAIVCGVVIASIISLIPDWPTRGQFGDMFGSVNAILSGSALIAAIYAIYLQREELQLQRRELSLQRDEMARSRTELEAQTATARAQFEATKAQIRVAARQIEVEMVKMSSEGTVGGSKKRFEDQLLEMARRVDRLATKLDEL